jgi:hypothetical protein
MLLLVRFRGVMSALGERLAALRRRPGPRLLERLRQALPDLERRDQ